MRNLDLGIRIGAVDAGASGTVKRFGATLETLGRKYTKAEQAAFKASYAAEVAARSTASAGRDIAELGRAADRAEGPLTRLWRRLETIGRSRGTAALRGASSGLLALGRGAAGMGATAAVAAGGAAAFGVGRFGGGVIQTGADFEGYKELLNVLEGSEVGAKRALDWVDKFATTTPNRIDEVLRAFVKLRNAGIDPTDGTLKSLGEASAVFTPLGKSLDDVVEALADARMGEFERLKEFGIKANQTGNRVILTMGKVRVETTKDADAIQKAIVGIFNDKYSGAMARQAGTFAGMMSMLSDRWTNFKRNVGDAGVFGFVKRQLSELLSWIDKAADNGDLDRWAKQLSASLIDVATSLERMAKAVDWVQLAADIGTLARVIAGLVEGIGKLQKVSQSPWLNMIPSIGISRWAKDRVVDLVTPDKPRPPVELPRRLPQGFRNAPLPGLGGGPLSAGRPVKVEGRLRVELAPGLRIVENTFGEQGYRRGLVGDR